MRRNLYRKIRALVRRSWLVAIGRDAKEGKA